MAFREVSVNEIREVRRLWLGVAGLPGEPDVRRHTNIPAVATAGVPDALHREPGTAMISALGFTADHYAAARRTSGERAWASLYLGVPSSPEGGLVKRVWLDQWRMACAPTAPVHTVIGVDPADSGQGGDCGIVAASLTRDGVVAVIADKSARMTSDAWARAAVERQGRRTRERRCPKACSNSMRTRRRVRPARSHAGDEFPAVEMRDGDRRARRGLAAIQEGTGAGTDSRRAGTCLCQGVPA